MKICFLSSKSKKSTSLKKQMITKYGNNSVEEAEFFVCLGGDGFMLHSIHNYSIYNKPFYGINCGSVGFLLNKYNNAHLPDNINKAKTLILDPLKTTFENIFGDVTEHISFNEVSFMRATAMAAHLEIKVNGSVILDKLVADGILIATPAGSNAYNLACGGEKIPFNSNKLVLTSINSFAPLRWKGQFLNNIDKLEIKNISAKQYRKVNMFYDFKQKNNLLSCCITTCKEQSAKLLLLDKI